MLTMLRVPPGSVNGPALITHKKVKQATGCLPGTLDSLRPKGRGFAQILCILR